MLVKDKGPDNNKNKKRIIQFGMIVYKLYLHIRTFLKEIIVKLS